MRNLILIPDSNVIKRDYTGTFQPEAEKFKKSHGGEIHEFVVKNGRTSFGALSDQLSRFLDSKHGVFDNVVFMCHGFPDHIQLGIDRQNVLDISSKLSMSTKQNGHIILFCCSVSRSPGIPKKLTTGAVEYLTEHSYFSIANQICACSQRKVFGHYLKGHATRNPLVVEHTPGPRQCQINWLYTPKSPGWRQWREKFQSRIDTGDYSLLLSGA